MLDLARQMGQHDTGYIPDQATLNFLDIFFLWLLSGDA
jgi:hypothetical protein